VGVAASAEEEEEEEEEGVGDRAVGGVLTCSSVVHLLTLPKVILALSTWNRGISVGETAAKQDTKQSAKQNPE